MRAGEVGELAESPSTSLGGMRAQQPRTVLIRSVQRARDAIDQWEWLLSAEERPHSDAWFVIADGIRRVCWCVGAAIYCLHEWERAE